MVQLEAIKLSIKVFSNNLLDEIEGFKYQITMNVLLSKHGGNWDTEFAPVYFNSTTKTKINSKYMPDKSFPEIFIV